MRVAVLGPVTVQAGGSELALRGQRPRDLLALLVQRRETSVPAEVLLDVLWGDHATTLTVTAVHTVVARLRQQTSPDLVETGPMGYRLGLMVDTDERAFAEGVNGGRRVFAAHDASGACGLFRSALSLWRGPVPYQGVSDHLVLADRARLEELRCSAAEDLASALLLDPAQASANEAFELATELVRAHQLRESAYALAMHAAYRSGRQADALEIFHALRHRLRGDLGIEPSPSLRRLHARILAHDPQLSAAPTSQTAAASMPRTERPRRPRAATVAAPATPTVGRSHEVDSIVSALGRGHRLVTIVGSGGVGKSRLLAEVGLAATRGHIASAYLDLSTVGDVGVEELVDAMAQAAGLPDPGAIALEALVASMRTTRLLILVDEAEWTPRNVAVVVRAVLDGCPDVSFVVTSRVPLEVLGERKVLLGPLACPAPDATPEQVATAPAVHLLLARLTDHAPDLALDVTATAQIGAIARRVDGLPLALEIVAGYAATHTVADLLTLSRRVLDISAAEHGRPVRHRSLRETVMWSVERLDPSHRRVFDRLAVFVGPFDLDAVRAVVGPLASSEAPADDVAATMHDLVREALVNVDRGRSQLRFRLLRTVRELALESLAEAGNLADTRTRHRRWFAQRWSGQPRSDDLIEDVRSHYGDYVESLRSALKERDSATAADLVLTLTRYWLFGSWTGPGVRWTTRALDGGILSPIERARVQVQRASLALASEPATSRADALEAAPVLSAADDRHWLVTAYTSLALELYASGDRSGSVAAATASVDVGRSVSPERLADALGVQALALAATGQAADATAAVDEAAAIVSDSGSMAARISVFSNLALALIDLGDYSGALSLLDAVAVEIPRLLEGTPDFFALNTGWAALGCGDLERARAAFHAGLGEGAAVRADRHTAEGYTGLACTVTQQGSPEGPLAVHLAGELSSRVGLVLTPGQRRCVDRALNSRPGPGSAQQPDAVALEACSDVELVSRLAQSLH